MVTTACASVHIADLTAHERDVVRDPVHRMHPGERGLRASVVGDVLRLGEPVRIDGRRRTVAVYFWSDEAALGEFVDEHPVAAVLGSGECLRLFPVRMSGSWPGLVPYELEGEPPDDADTVAALTMVRPFERTARRFARLGARVQATVSADSDVVRSLEIAGDDVQATFTVWRTVDALTRFAYREGMHRRAMASHTASPMYDDAAFVRFRIG